MKKHLNFLSILVLIFVLFIFSSSAFAYLDPGTGSMFLQLLLGGIAGLAVFLKLSWKWLLAKLGVHKEDKPN